VKSGQMACEGKVDDKKKGGRKYLWVFSFNPASWGNIARVRKVEQRGNLRSKQGETRTKVVRGRGGKHAVREGHWGGGVV